MKIETAVSCASSSVGIFSLHSAARGFPRFAVAVFAHCDGQPPRDSVAPMLRERILERRSKPRIEGLIPATVRGTTTSGESFEIHTRLDNLSASGLRVSLDRPAAIASPVFSIFHLPGIEVRAKGVVRRIEMQPDGSFGLGVAFENYRIY